MTSLRLVPSQRNPEPTPADRVRLLSPECAPLEQPYPHRLRTREDDQRAAFWRGFREAAFSCALLLAVSIGLALAVRVLEALGAFGP